ncbi:MAG: hypothetical protein QE271_13130 [Bacteriovoracaceae bacterium]|nr:hypothetical protein [Bacteriovoracaceae bacterium]
MKILVHFLISFLLSNLFVGCARKAKKSSPQAEQINISKISEVDGNSQSSKLINQHIWKLTKQDSQVTIFVIGTTHIPASIEDVSNIKQLIGEFPPTYYAGEVDLTSTFPEDGQMPISQSLIKHNMLRLNVAALDCLGFKKMAQSSAPYPPISHNSFEITTPIYQCISRHKLRLTLQSSAELLKAFYEIQYFKLDQNSMSEMSLEHYVQQNLQSSLYEHLNLDTFVEEFYRASFVLFRREQVEKNEKKEKLYNTLDEAIAHYLESKNASALEALDNDQTIEELYNRVYNEQISIAKEIKKFDRKELEVASKEYSSLHTNSSYSDETNRILYALYSDFSKTRNQPKDQIQNDNEKKYMEVRNRRWAKRISSLMNREDTSSPRRPINIYILGGEAHFNGHRNVLEMLKGRVDIQKLKF